MPSLSEEEIRCQKEREAAGGVVQVPCGVFPVESGGPVIGLGLLFFIVAIVSGLFGISAVTLPVIILFGGFGIFLIWLGLTK